MFIAMNRFRIKPGHEADFEEIWASRDSHLDGVPGFRAFHLLRGPTGEEHTLYASHTEWESREHFQAWTQSDAFRKAHAQARPNRDIYMGPPAFEGFEAVQELLPTATGAAGFRGH
jgi:heme-degrading monooxygenase HmoA